MSQPRGLMLAWNGFQQSLARLYCVAIGNGPANQHIAVCSALKSDRAQRNNLLAAVENHMMSASPSSHIEHGEWLRNQAQDAKTSEMMPLTRHFGLDATKSCSALTTTRAPKLLRFRLSRLGRKPATAPPHSPLRNQSLRSKFCFCVPF